MFSLNRIQGLFSERVLSVKVFADQVSAGRCLNDVCPGKHKPNVLAPCLVIAAALFLGMGTAVAQQEINPDHFEDKVTSGPPTRRQTHARNLQTKTKATKPAQAGQNGREDKNNHARKVARSNPHEHGSNQAKNHS